MQDTVFWIPYAPERPYLNTTHCNMASSLSLKNFDFLITCCSLRFDFGFSTFFGSSITTPFLGFICSRTSSLIRISYLESRQITHVQFVPPSDFPYNGFTHRTANKPESGQTSQVRESLPSFSFRI